ncbi:MAG: calcium/sodium antiporter [Candidatus Thioglobus sp.]|nr:MAG: calcium/sodium antiporter [Candidatus Thioglobus sp.]
MLLPIIALLTGFTLLIYSADKFTENGAKIATIFQVSPLVIGLLIFGFGTSAPEILVSALAAMDGNTGISIGNAIGSNIFNISLVLGLSAIIYPIEVSGSILKKEWLFLMFVTVITGFLLWDKHLGIVDGLILTSLLLVFLTYTFKTAKNHPTNEFDEILKNPEKKQLGKTWFLLIISLLTLIFSAKIIVWGGVQVAKSFGISDLIIGLSVISIGTSLPELAVSISSVLKKQYAMIVGNVIGSNLFNTLAVLAIPGLIHPAEITSEILDRDYLVMLLLTVLLFIVAYKIHKKHIINRFEGGLLVAIFGVYMWQLF